MTKEQFGASMPDIPVFSATDMQYVLNEKRSLELRLSHLSAVNEKLRDIIAKADTLAFSLEQELKKRPNWHRVDLITYYEAKKKLADEMGEGR